jgi:hypothetical protein
LDFRLDDFHQLLRFRSRDERAFVAEKCLAKKFHGAEQMLKRFARATASDEFTQPFQFRFVQLALEFEIKFDPFPCKHMGQQVLGIQTRALDVMLLEIHRCGLQHFKHGHRSI